MPESAEEVYARIVALVDEEGHLPTPPIAEWDTFPWEGVTHPRKVLPPVETEQPRTGIGGRGCWRCDDPDRNVIWRNERWVVSTMDKPSGLPIIVFLMPKEHLDYTDLDDEMAGEHGQLSVWLARIITHLPNIGRVHVNKWGDGGEHLHTWFVARTARMPQTIGSYAVEWDEILPDVPEDIWRADLRYVAERMATHDGESLA
jgi:hypothetical protein